MRPSGRLPGGDRHVEGLDAELGSEMVFESPADGLAREGVEDGGEEDEGFAQADVGDVGDPDLVRPRGDETADQVGHDAESVPAVGGLGHEGALAQGEQIVLAHQAQNPLSVHLEALPLELRGHRAVAIGLVFEGDGVDGARTRIGFAGALASPRR